MIEKVRLSVDEETANLLRMVSEELGGMYSAPPKWADEHRAEILAALREVLSEKPIWIKYMRAEIRRVLRSELRKLLSDDQNQVPIGKNRKTGKRKGGGLPAKSGSKIRSKTPKKEGKSR